MNREQRRGERDPTARALELGPTRREGTAQMARGRDERRGSLAACGRNPDKERPEHQTLIGPLALYRVQRPERWDRISVWCHLHSNNRGRASETERAGTSQQLRERMRSELLRLVYLASTTTTRE